MPHRPMIVRRWTLFLCLAVLLLGLVQPHTQAVVGDTDRISRAFLHETVRVMVQLESSPLADSNPSGNAQEHANRLRQERESLRTALVEAGIPYRELSTHEHLFNGLSLQVRNGDIPRIGAIKGVTGIFMQTAIRAPKPQLASSVKMIGAQRAWAGDPTHAIPGVDGTGIKVAVIDTGIDYSHPDLGGCLGASCRVVGGYDFVGDAFDGNNTPVPDADPMDQNGHGTHVAGIIGARAASSEGVTGVAPGVNFVALKIFGPSGHTWDDMILQALETAYRMRVDVINMSIGAPFEWPQSPTSQAVQRLADKGITVAVSAGNEGDAGEFAVGSPASGTGALAVASFENDQTVNQAFLDPAATPVRFDTMAYSPPLPARGESAEVVYVGQGTQESDFVNADGSSKVAGKVALIERGKITFREKSQRAQRYGATQAIIFNNQPGRFQGTLQSPGQYIPTISILRNDGLRLVEMAKQGPIHLTWSNHRYLFDNESAGLISDFSSWGPTPNLAIKPDLTAPGGQIYSTYLTSQGGYASLSGTSMAAPHVAGAAALLLQARRAMAEHGGAAQVKATAVRTLLMNTAQPRTQGLGSALLYPVHRQGAGMIDVWRAITATQRVLPEKLELGVVQAGTTLQREIVIENIGSSDEVYHFAAIGPDGIAVNMQALPESLVVNAGQTKHVVVELTIPPSLPEGRVFSGWIAIINHAGDAVAHIPYLGFKGDYQAASALDPLTYGLPWLARLQGDDLLRSESVTIHPHCGCDDESAWILYSLARQPQELRIEIWDAQTGRKWGNASSARHLLRSAGAIESFQWAGFNDKGRPVRAGTYVLRLMILRPLGDPARPEHWDIWTSGRIQVVWG